MTVKQRDVYTTMYYRHGNSYGITIPPDLREQMHLNPGDHFAMNYAHGILWMVKLTPDTFIPREKVMLILEKLFPSKVPKDGTD